MPKREAAVWLVPMLVWLGAAMLLLPELSDRGAWRHDDTYALTLVTTWLRNGETSLPYLAGWSGAEEATRGLPPLHLWLSLPVGLVVGEGPLAPRLTSFLEATTAVMVVGAWGRWRGGTRVGALAATLLLLWRMPVGAGHWDLPWWDMAIDGRWDAIALLGVTVIGFAVDRALRGELAWGWCGLVAGVFGIGGVPAGCAAAVALLTLITAGLHRGEGLAPTARRCGVFLAGAAVGPTLVLLWVATASGGFEQWAIRIGKSTFSLANEWKRWGPGVLWPSLAMAMFVLAPLIVLVARRGRDVAGWLAVGVWIGVACLDNAGNETYAAAVLGAVCVLLAERSVGRWRVVAMAVAVLCCADGLDRVTRRRPPPDASYAAVSAALPPVESGQRIYGDERFWWALQGRDIDLSACGLVWFRRELGEPPVAVVEAIDLFLLTPACRANLDDFPAVRDRISERVTSWETHELPPPFGPLHVGYVAD